MANLIMTISIDTMGNASVSGSDEKLEKANSVQHAVFENVLNALGNPATACQSRTPCTICGACSEDDEDEDDWDNDDDWDDEDEDDWDDEDEDDWDDEEDEDEDENEGLNDELGQALATIAKMLKGYMK